MNLKSHLTCKICGKILDDPYFLPCLCSSFCKCHADSIEKLTCDICHEVIAKPKDGFKPNKAFKNIIDNNEYLTEEEKISKTNLEKLLDDVERFVADLEIKEQDLMLIRPVQFDDLKRDISLRREKLLDKIDQVFFGLMNKLESIQLKLTQMSKNNALTLKELSPQKEKKFLSDLFRKPHLTLNVIQDYETKLKEYQSKLLEIESVNDNEIYTFEVDLNFTDASFGILKPIPKMKQHLITCSLDSNEIHILDMKTNLICKKLLGHSLGIVCLELSIDKQMVISGSLDSSIKVWDIRNGTCLNTLQGHTVSIVCLKALENNLLASGAFDRKIIIWDLTSGQKIKELKGHVDYIRCLDQLSNGQLCSGSKDKEIKLWSLNDEKLVKTLKGHTDSIRCLKTLPNLKLVSGADDKTIRVWDTAASKGECIQVVNGAHSNGIVGLELLSSELLISCCGDNYIKVWNLSAKGLNCILNLTQRHIVRCMKLSTDGKVFGGTEEKSVKVWDPRTGECLRTFKQEFLIDHLQLTFLT